MCQLRKEQQLLAAQKCLNKTNMKKALSTFIILLFVCQAILAFNGKHKYHTSFTRIDYNKEAKSLEISIKVFAHDLLPTLNNKLGKKVDLESTENIDKILQDYLTEKFTFKTKLGEAKSLKWVGKELETDVIRFYIEIPFEGDLEGAEIRNTMFFETFARQVNLISIYFGEKKAGLVFKVGDSFKTIIETQKK